MTEEVPKPERLSGVKRDGKVMKKEPSSEKTSETVELDETTVSELLSTDPQEGIILKEKWVLAY